MLQAAFSCDKVLQGHSLIAVASIIFFPGFPASMAHLVNCEQVEHDTTTHLLRNCPEARRRNVASLVLGITLGAGAYIALCTGAGPNPQQMHSTNVRVAPTTIQPAFPIDSTTNLKAVRPLPFPQDVSSVRPVTRLDHIDAHPSDAQSSFGDWPPFLSTIRLLSALTSGAVITYMATRWLSAKKHMHLPPVVMMSTLAAKSETRAPFQPSKPSVYGETLDTLTACLVEAGYPAFRATQVMKWLYKKRATDWDAMTDLPKALRAWLGEHFALNPAAPILDKRSADETQKVLMELEDRALIETVLIQAPQDEDTGDDPDLRKTICVSSQVGCGFGCKFCASGLAGWKRNLKPSEIIGQLMNICQREDPHTPRTSPEIVPFDNVVFMGMGEPLANYDTLVRVLEIMNAKWGLHFGARRITVSTSGLAPRIRQLADAGVAVRLAISLHGATNAVRDQIMPVNERYPLEELIPAAKYFQQKHGRMLTLEFILIEGVNDSREQATALVKIARELHAHVNCIPYNVVEGLPWKRPSIARQDAFVKVLKDAGVSSTIRRQKGDDIAAACGQLRLKVEKEREAAPA